MKKRYFAFFVLIFIGCTGGTAELSEILNKRIRESFDTTKKVRVVFATNRKENTKESPACSNRYFPPVFSEKAIFGVCEVSVPAGHDVGTIDINSNGEEEKFFRFTGYSQLEPSKFVEMIKTEASEEIMVFVHGFNVKFEEAVVRAAQMQYDLKFQGPIVLFTWPAGSEEGFLQSLLIKNTYSNNFQSAKGSIKAFSDFLMKISESGKKIHLIVHSMGHQVAVPGIAGIYSTKNMQFLQEVIFNAPDYDAVEFRNFSEVLKKASKRLTIYCSPGDNALVASAKVNTGKRAGMCEKYPGIDVINVNPVDSPVLGIGGLGHGYYSSRPILTDLYQLLMGIEVKKRLFIRRSDSATEEYVLRK